LSGLVVQLTKTHFTNINNPTPAFIALAGNLNLNFPLLESRKR